MSVLNLSFLGTFDGTLDHEPLSTFRSNKARALLAYLTVDAQQAHPRGRLSALLWPESTEEQAQNSMRVALRQVRLAIQDQGAAPPFLLINRQSIQRNAAAEINVDVHQFEQLVANGDSASRRQAIALYKGDFLAGLSHLDCPEFESWILLKREYYARIALTVLAEETEYCITNGHYVDAQSFARRQLELDEWRESAHRQLMDALARNGERNAALAQYERCQQLLWEDLGVEPEEATTTLYEQIKRGIPLADEQDRDPQDKPTLNPQSSGQQGVGKLDSGGQDNRSLPLAPPPLAPPPLLFEDWGEMPAVESVYGREEEIEHLIDWIETENTRFVAILGIGGQGKTTLAATYVRSLLDQPLQQPFIQVIWRSLLNAPPLMEVLQSWLGILVDESEVSIPQSLDEALGLLFQILRARRTLLILDNVESILAAGAQSGGYRTAYEAYGQLFKRMGEGDHQSCLLITSRERPPKMVHMEQRLTVARTLQLDGLSLSATIEMLDGLSLAQGGAGQDGASQEAGKPKIASPAGAGWQELVARYSGNPLALLMVADTIDGLFDGDVNAFLQDEGLIFDDVRDVLDEQFARLTALERTILIWLAIERDGITAVELRNNLLQIGPQRTFLEALRSLQRRSLLTRSQGEESSGQQSKHTQPGDLIAMQNVIIEYATELFIDTLYAEITGGDELDENKPSKDGPGKDGRDEQRLLLSHALLKAHSKEYVRNSQHRLIIEPLARRLTQNFSLDVLTQRMAECLDELRLDEAGRKSYAAGNILNLMLHMGLDPADADFSGLTIRNASLRNKTVRNVNFANAEFASSVFTETFSNVRQLFFSPDGKLIAGGTSLGEVRLWSGDGHQPVANLTGHSKIIYCINWNTDGRLLASGGEDGTVRLWERKTVQSTERGASGSWHGRVLYRSAAIVRAVAFRPFRENFRTSASRPNDASGKIAAQHDEQRYTEDEIVATAGNDQQIRLWSTSTELCYATLHGHSHVITMITFSPDGELLASCSADGSIRIWSLQGIVFDGPIYDDIQGRILLQLPHEAMEVWTVAFSPDGARLAAGSLDGTIWVWHVAQLKSEAWSTARPVAPAFILKEHQQSVQQLTFSPDSNMLASGGDDRLIRLWNVETGSVINTLQGHTDVVLSLAFRPDGQLLASGSLDGTMRLWNPQTGFLEQTLSGTGKPFTSVALGPTSDLLMTASGDNNARLWHLEPIRNGHDQPDSGPIDHDNISRTTEAKPKAEQIRATCRHVLSNHETMIWAVALSPDGRWGASASEDLSVALWRVEDGSLHGLLLGHEHIVTAVDFSPTGKIVASGSIDQVCRLWDVATGDCLATLTDGSGVYDVHNAIWSVAFSADGQQVAAGFGNGSIVIWHVSTGEIAQILRGHTEWVRGVAFSPDGATLISGSNDCMVCVWALETGELLSQLEGHTDWVMTVAFNADGKTFATAGHDQTIRLWHLDQKGTGEKEAGEKEAGEKTTSEKNATIAVETLTAHTNSILAIDFSGDGKILASASIDETVKLWDVASRTCLKSMRTIGPYENTKIAGTTGLTDAQWLALLRLGAVGDSTFR